jgi:hypothetical protein
MILDAAGYGSMVDAAEYARPQNPAFRLRPPPAAYGGQAGGNLRPLLGCSV